MQPTDLHARGCAGCSKLHPTAGAISIDQSKRILFTAFT